MPLHSALRSRLEAVINDLITVKTLDLSQITTRLQAILVDDQRHQCELCKQFVDVQLTEADCQICDESTRFTCEPCGQYYICDWC